MKSSLQFVVTGANGFLGRRLCEYLTAKNYVVDAWTREIADLRDTKAVERQIAKFNPDCIFHLAASTPNDNDTSWEKAAEEVLMFSNLALAAKRNCRIIVAGSMAEFGFSGVHAERAICRPDTAYGFAKNATTNAAVSIAKMHNMEICVARLFGVYGIGESDRRLIPLLVRELSRDVVVPLSDGNQIRDFVHIDDVCNCLFALATMLGPMPALINIGTGVGVSVRSVCMAVAKHMNQDVSRLGFGLIKRRSVDQDLLVADSSMLATIMSIPVADFDYLNRLGEYVEYLLGQCSVPLQTKE